MRVRFSFGCDQVLLCLLLISISAGCSRSTDESPIAPPLTFPLARDYIGFGVVNVSFTHLLTEPGPAGVSLGYLRRGSVVRIIERRQLINRDESWVRAEGNYSSQAIQGWLPEDNIDVFESESRAITASKAMNP